MDTRLTFKEKKYAQELIRNSKNRQVTEWPEWAGLVLLAIGGFLMAAACFITAGNLSALSIEYVLFPGIVFGLILAFCGLYIQKMSRKSEEHEILVSLIEKLMVQNHAN